MEKSNLLIRKDKDGITVLIGKHNIRESIQYIQTHQVKKVKVTYYYEETQVEF